jgi:hypothetical protein
MGNSSQLSGTDDSAADDIQVRRPVRNSDVFQESNLEREFYSEIATKIVSESAYPILAKVPESIRPPSKPRLLCQVVGRGGHLLQNPITKRKVDAAREWRKARKMNLELLSKF